MARQSGRERRGNLDEKRQPYQTIFAPSPDRRKSRLLVRLEIAAKRQSAPAGFVVAAAFIGLRGWMRRPVVRLQVRQEPIV